MYVTLHRPAAHGYTQAGHALVVRLGVDLAQAPR
jgi:hypothetical protein